MRVIRALMVSMLLSVPAYADNPFALPSESAKKAADIASWGTVGTALVMDAFSCRGTIDPRHCLVMMGVRMAVTEGTVEGLKHLIKQPRPCAPACEGYGMPSGHTAFAFSAVGGASIAVSIPLGLGTGTGRVLADKHTLVQVLAGAGIGLLTSRIR